MVNSQDGLRAAIAEAKATRSLAKSAAECVSGGGGGGAEAETLEAGHFLSPAGGRHGITIRVNRQTDHLLYGMCWAPPYIQVAASAPERDRATKEARCCRIMKVPTALATEENMVPLSHLSTLRRLSASGICK